MLWVPGRALGRPGKVGGTGPSCGIFGIEAEAPERSEQEERTWEPAGERGSRHRGMDEVSRGSNRVAEAENPRDRKAPRLREDMGLREGEEPSAGASGSGKSQKQKEDLSLRDRVSNYD